MSRVSLAKQLSPMRLYKRFFAKSRNAKPTFGVFAATDRTRKNRRLEVVKFTRSVIALVFIGLWVPCFNSAHAKDQTVAIHPELWPKAHSPASFTDAKTEKFVTDLMAKMSIEEKVGQTIQPDISTFKPEDLRTYPFGSVLAGGDSAPRGDNKAPAAEWVEMMREFRKVSTEERPGHIPIPIIFGIDAVHGHNNIVGATIFPHNIGLGAAHDPELLKEIGKATAEEVAATGMDWTFAPGVMVPRDDRWGRTYEGYSEDPAIVRAYAGQMTLGLQGAPSLRNAVQAGHIAATAKHWLADGGTDDGKNTGDSSISEEDLIRLHAPGYVSAIDAGAMTIMASYSAWHGERMHGNRVLLTDVLKGRMGFEGFVVSDWSGFAWIPGCKPDHCAAALNSGLDMFMAPTGWADLYKNTIDDVRSGAIPMARLDDAVRRILRVKVKLGLFNTNRPYEGRLNLLGDANHRALARRAVRESLVLLKDDGVLPIRSSAHVLVAGSGADDIGMQCGGWTISWQGTKNTNADFPNGQSIFAGIKEAVDAHGGDAILSVDGSFAQKPDVAIVVFGEAPYAEGFGDRPNVDYQPGDRTDLALIKKLKAAGVPVVSVFLSGRPLWVDPEIGSSDAFVAAWLPGSEGGGVSDLLIGDVHGKPRHDFRGKLSYSWPKSTTQTPLNVGDANYDPRFAYGYGLTYAGR